MTDKKKGRAGKARYTYCAECGSVEVYVATTGWYCPVCDKVNVKVERT